MEIRDSKGIRGIFLFFFVNYGFYLPFGLSKEISCSGLNLAKHVNTQFLLFLYRVEIENHTKQKSRRLLTYVWRSRVLWVQCNIEEVKVFESLRDLRVDPDLDAPAPPPPPSSRRSNPSDVALRAPLHTLHYYTLDGPRLTIDCCLQTLSTMYIVV